MGRPNKFGEPTKTRTFRIPVSKIDEVTDKVDEMLDSYVPEKVENPLPITEKEYKQFHEETRTENLPDECQDCRYTTIKSTGLRLRMSMCQKCKDEKKLKK